MKARSLVLLLTLVPGLALAHEGAGAHGWLAGLAHPLLGLDHLLVMLAVGMLGARLGGKTVWRLPLLFVGLLAVGAVLALNGISLPYIEQGILLSVVLFGLLLALPRISAQLGMALVAGFALYHGMAHGAEMPLAASAMVYLAGMVLSTAALHLAGVIGFQSLKLRLVQAGGLGMAATGLVMALA